MLNDRGTLKKETPTQAHSRFLQCDQQMSVKQLELYLVCSFCEDLVNLIDQLICLIRLYEIIYRDESSSTPFQNKTI